MRRHFGDINCHSVGLNRHSGDINRHSGDLNRHYNTLITVIPAQAGIQRRNLSLRYAEPATIDSGLRRNDGEKME